MIELLIFILTIFGTGILSGTLTYFLWFNFGSPDDEGFEKGRIFSFYGKWLSKNYNAFEKKHPDKLNWYKALGLCSLCFGTWIGLFVGIGLSFLFQLPLLQAVVFVMFLPGVNLITIKLIKP